jgi:hypothetical protein
MLSLCLCLGLAWRHCRAICRLGCAVQLVKARCVVRGTRMPGDGTEGSRHCGELHSPLWAGCQWMRLVLPWWERGQQVALWLRQWLQATFDGELLFYHRTGGLDGARLLGCPRGVWFGLGCRRCCSFEVQVLSSKFHGRRDWRNRPYPKWNHRVRGNTQYQTTFCTRAPLGDYLPPFRTN